jgi:hypothetical protein
MRYIRVRTAIQEKYPSEWEEMEDDWDELFVKLKIELTQTGRSGTWARSAHRWFREKG